MSAPYYTDDHVTVHHGDCRDVLATLPEASIDAIVTDPPYELGFMGKGWDSAGVAYDPATWAACLRVLKPGGHLVSFGGTRTWHRMVCAVEDAGFEIRDEIMWLYGTGFPKSLNASKAIDKAAGAEREVVGERRTNKGDSGPQTYAAFGAFKQSSSVPVTAPATDAASQWNGWGTALKPAHEPICLARKPLVGTVAANVLAHGTGALNVDGCRIGTEGGTKAVNHRTKADGRLERWDEGSRGARNEIATLDAGRWPANVMLDDTAAAMLDAQSGTLTSGKLEPHHADNGKEAGTFGAMPGYPGRESYGDTGGASRFFYVAKAAQHERPKVDGIAHPTVKPVALMRWLVRLVTPPDGVVLDPFAGTGTTAEAAIIEGHRCVLVEAEADHLPLIQARLAKPIAPTLFGGGA